MSKPKVEVGKKDYRRQVKKLYQKLGSSGAKGAKALLAELLTDSERRMLHRRWYIATLLAAGLNVRQAARQAKTSTLTVMRVKRLLECSSAKGLRQAFKRPQKLTHPKKSRAKSKTVVSRLIFGGGER